MASLESRGNDVAGQGPSLGTKTCLHGAVRGTTSHSATPDPPSDGVWTQILMGVVRPEWGAESEGKHALDKTAGGAR